MSRRRRRLSPPPVGRAADFPDWPLIGTRQGNESLMCSYLPSLSTGLMARLAREQNCLHSGIGSGNYGPIRIDAVMDTAASANATPRAAG
jgi:hypothetical protein